MCSDESTTARVAHARRRRAAGFSFIEIMVVVVIIGLLAGAVTLKVMDYMDTAKLNRAKSDLATIVDAVEACKLNTGKYPTNEEQLEKLPLSNRIDPWGNQYVYTCPGQKEAFDVISLGADGRDGGDGRDADISCWQIVEKKK
jgi:general secretion pathway protein G